MSGIGAAAGERKAGKFAQLPARGNRRCDPVASCRDDNGKVIGKRYWDAFANRPSRLRIQEGPPMGQIIAFPLPPTPYPDLAADLDRAECILLIAIRWWVTSVR